jgi:hypothetical protein
MEFDCQSGKHFKTVTAHDYEHAAKVFLLSMLAETNAPKLGEVIQVSCKVKENFFDTNDTLIDLGGYGDPMKIYNGESADGGEGQN